MEESQQRDIRRCKRHFRKTATETLLVLFVFNLLSNLVRYLLFKLHTCICISPC
jgi:hypothetical protein